MLRSYLKTGARHLLRNKVFALINVGGLALGISIAILIGLWVNDEFTFNYYHKNHERLAQVYKWSGQDYLPYPLTVELKQNYSENFKNMATANPAYDHIVSAGAEHLSIAGQFVEPALPAMLTLEMKEGTYDGLKDPYSIMISESVAQTLFGDKSALDQFVRLDNKFDVKVTGVYKDLPHHSSFHKVKFFTTWELFLINSSYVETAGWDDHFLFVYVELDENVTFEEVAPRIVEAEMNVIRHLNYMKEEAAENTRIWLHPMDRWHLHSTYDPEIGGFGNGPVRFVYLVSAIGVFVLLLACINFMNLATARSEKRMREVGIRKSIGSLRSQLIGQFFTESFIVVAISFGVAVVLASLFLPAFNELSGKEIEFPFIDPGFWFAGFVLMFVTGVLAASYPALYLSSFRPAVVLKGKLRTGNASRFFRGALVTIQFTVSISLIISTIVVYKQVMFAKDREVGYTRDRLLMIPGRGMNSLKFEALRAEILKTGVAKEVSSAGGKVTSAWSQGGGFEWVGKDPNTTPTIGTLGIGSQFGQTVGWKMVAGRDFDESLLSDSSAIIINESTAKLMGFDDPVGQVVHWKSKWHFVDKDFRIVGVVGNLMMKSPYDNVMPAVFYLQGYVGTVHVSLADHVNSGDALAKIQTVYRNIVPDQPFEYAFADDEYNTKFAYEERVGKLATVFAVLAVVISCLGLFGMASFMTERRTKEIGVRKVVGASVFSLWRLLSKEFVFLVLLSFSIASPLVFYALDQWMESFTYRAPISWEVFAGAGLGSLAIALSTISYRLLKAARQNPAHSLRSE